MKTSISKYAVALVIGALLGITGPRYGFLGWFSLIPWGIAGLALGYWSNKRERVLIGVLYGFSLCFTFMIAGYTGTASLLSRFPFFAIMGAFGSICGPLLSFLGFFLKDRLTNPQGTLDYKN